MQLMVAETALPDVKRLHFKLVSDNRGWFAKTFHAPTFAEAGLETQFPESFISRSTRNVLRGMHFQLPPHDHTKIVRCVTGRILDVIVDLRNDSATFGQYASLELDGASQDAVYIPRGFAHGFLTLSDEALVEYHTSTVHAPSHDTGIRWDSFGFAWPAAALVISARDRAFVGIREFDSPFRINRSGAST